MLAVMLGITCYLAIAGGGLWMENKRLRRAQVKLIEETSNTDQINPLKSRFLNERVRLYDLRSPAGEPIGDRTFDECQLIGPAVIALSGSSIDNPRALHNVEFLALPSDGLTFSPNKMVLQGCRISRCSIYNVIFLVANSERPMFEKEFPQIPWLN